MAKNFRGKLLTVGNAKTAKGTKLGFGTAILHLSPYKASGFNVCPMAEIASCWQGCLNTDGRGGIAKGNATAYFSGVELPDNVIQRARVRKTQLLYRNPRRFWVELIGDIYGFLDFAEEHRLTPCVRLNGTSDLRWEVMRHDGKTIFERFPNVQFYDYTKILNRRNLPDNYDLTVSWSGANQGYATKVQTLLHQGQRIAVVGDLADVAQGFEGYNVVDGDATDLRFLDPPGSVVALKPKGKARLDTSGFVYRGVE